MSTTDGLFTWDDVIRVAKLEAGKHDLIVDAYSILEFDEDDRAWFMNQAYDDILTNTWGFTNAYYARIYYAGWNAILSVTPASGEGNVSSENIGTVSVGKTQAFNNPLANEIELANLLGKMYSFYKDRALKNQEAFLTGVG